MINRKWNQIKICFVVRSYPSRNNPARGNNVYTLAHSLSDLGNNVIVISQTRDVPHEWYDNKIRVCEIGPRHHTNNVMSYLGFCYRLFNTLRTITKTENIEVAECQLIGALGLPFFLFSRKSRSVALVIQVITSSEDTIRIGAYANLVCHLGFIVMDKMEKIMLKRANMLITPSQQTKDKFIREYHVPEQKVQVATLGVNTKFYRPDSCFPKHDGNFKMLFVGSLQKRKNIQLLLYAINELRNKIPDMSVVLVGPHGDMPYYEKLQEIVKDLKLQEIVKFLGPVSDTEKLNLLKSCDIFVSPSNKESFGDAVMEGMACAKPVIVTSGFMGINELVETGKTGVIVPTNDVRALADAIWSLYTIKEDKRREMGLQGREHVIRNFSIEKEIIKRYRAYEKAAKMINS